MHMHAPQISCCFSGYRPGKLPWGNDENDPRCRALKACLRDVMEAAYDEGYRHFICGMAQGCDLYFCELALQLRGERPDMTIEAAIPCRTQADSWSAEERRRWRGLTSRRFCRRTTARTVCSGATATWSTTRVC